MDFDNGNMNHPKDKRPRFDDDNESAGNEDNTCTTNNSKTISNEIQITVPTSNVYSMLTEDNTNTSEDVVVIKRAVSSVAGKKQRIPPITVNGVSRKEVHDICKRLCIVGFTISFTKNGINVYTADADDFKKLRKFLRDADLPAFTHDLQSEKSFRVILKGLFEMDLEELKAELAANKIAPIELKMLPVRKRKYDDQVNYVLHFLRGSTKLNDLRKVRYLFQIRIDWDFYSPRNHGPVRCRRCQRWGHGSKNCSMPVACMFCAEPHDTNSCKHVIDGEPVQGFLPKCANCSENHPANNERCAKLLEFLSIQQMLADRNAKKNVTKLVKSNPVVGHTKPSSNTASSRHTLAPPRSYSAVAARGNQLRPSGDEMMSPQQMLALTKEMMTALRNCRTKEDQFNAIANLAIRYVYNYGQP